MTHNMIIAIGFAMMIVGLAVVMIGVWKAPMIRTTWTAIKPGDPDQVLTIDKDGKGTWDYPKNK